MREIKYRALAKDGTWRYGYYPCLNVDIGNAKYPMDIFWNSFLASFRRETLGQWTGLKDKQGKEIYEGDIVNFIDYRQERIGQIKWDEGVASFCVRYKYWLIRPDDNYYDFSGLRNYEVIGNIYENPELLERQTT